MMLEVAIIPFPALLGISLILVGGREIQRFAVRGGHVSNFKQETIMRSDDGLAR